MERQLAALGLGVGAAVAEALCLHGESMRWQDLQKALGDELSSRGTLTKTLTRLAEADLVVKRDGMYELAHPTRTRLLLQVAAELSADVSAAQSRAAETRARNLRAAVMRPVDEASA